jgi:hypothetical protein
MQGYKTIIFGALVALLGFLEGFDITHFAQYIPDAYEPLVLSGIGFIVVVLRFFTSTAALKKE